MENRTARLKRFAMKVFEWGAKRFLWGAKRSVVWVLVGAAAVLGGILGSWLAKEVPAWLTSGAPVLGGGLVLSTVKEWVSVWSSLSKFYASWSSSLKVADWGILREIVGTSFVSSLGLFLAVHGKPLFLPQAPVFLQFKGDSFGVVFPSESLITFYVTFDAEVLTDEDLKKPEHAGLTIGGADRELLLKTVAPTLLACAESSPVELEFVGFASSSCKAGRTTEQCQNFNRDVANARAQSAQKLFDDWSRLIVKEALQAKRMTWKAHKWDKFEPMETGRRFFDESAGSYSPMMGRLNRRVEVRLTKAGDCLAANRNAGSQTKDQLQFLP